MNSPINNLIVQNAGTAVSGLLVGNGASAVSAALAANVSAALDLIGATQGNILYRNASGWVVLAPGTAGQVLQSGGAGANVAWGSAGGGGDVVGPASSTASALARFDGLTGKLLKNSLAILSDAGALQLTAYGAGLITSDASGNLTSSTIGTSLALSAGTLNAIQDIRTTATPQFARLGLGQVADATAQLALLGSALPVLSVTRTTAITNDTASGMRLVGRTSGDAVDGFGTLFLVYMEDDTTIGSPQPLGGFGAIRDGADNSGKASIRYAAAGLFTQGLAVGSLGIETLAPSGGTVSPWKLGNYTAGVAAQVGKVRVEIAGVPYDLLTG